MNSQPTPSGQPETAGVILYLGIAFAFVFQGAFYIGPFVVSSLLILAAAVVAVQKPMGRRPTVPLWPAVLPLMISTTISGIHNVRLRSSLPTLLMLLVVAAVFIVVERMTETSRFWIVRALINTSTLLSLVGILGVLFHQRPLALVDGKLWRAASTLTYANASGCLFAAMLVVSLGIAGQPFARPSRSSAFVIPLLTAGLISTGSRAGIVGLALGITVLLVTGHSQTLRRQAFPIASGIVLALGVAVSMPAVGQPSAAVRAICFVTACCLSFAISWMATQRRPPADAETNGRLKPLTRIGLVAAIATTAAAAVLFIKSTPLAGRFSGNSPDRWREWNAAYKLFRENPGLGVGPGSIRLELAGPTPRTVAFAHNELLQIVAQQGLLGALAVLIGVLWCTRKFRFGNRRNSGKKICCIFLAGSFTIVIHSLFDYVLHIPALSATLAVLIGITTGESNSNELPPQSR